MRVNFEADQVFDRSNFLSTVQGNLDLLRELTRLFLEDCPNRLITMREGLARGDFQVLEHVAHLFKGSAGYFAAPRTFAAAARLETIARSGDLVHAEDACAELDREVLRLMQVLAAIQ